jgi:superfamily II DNA or RNA helicase
VTSSGAEAAAVAAPRPTGEPHDDSAVLRRLRCRHAWRPYQQRVLAAVDSHLRDRRLHLVAAPGAGKTTLGLEVFRRLGRRALVLSPTRVIRDQWLARLDDFLPEPGGPRPAWASDRLDAPGLITSITYQALSAWLRGTGEVEQANAADDNEAEAADEAADEGDEPGRSAGRPPALDKARLQQVAERLQAQRVGVLILDEAHHLTAHWWRLLDALTEAMPQVTVVALTGTPPYEAADADWQRYQRLCGPVDEEVSVPELVKAGTLCPHQDYVWAVDADRRTAEQVREHDARVDAMLNGLCEDGDFRACVRQHPWVAALATGVPPSPDAPPPLPAEVVAQVQADPAGAVSLLAFLQLIGDPLPPALAQLLDVRPADLPPLGRRHWQRLLQLMLFGPTAEHATVVALKKRLRALDLLHRRELSIERDKRVERSLSQCAAKIDACVEIHRLELSQRGRALRQVVLVDFIRDEALLRPREAEHLTLGAWPVFEALLAGSAQPEGVALLTGRLCAVAASRQAALAAHIAELGFEPLPRHPGFVRVSGPITALTAAFTALLQAGEIHTLVGTRALLGEGWDAPCVNSLVLATGVGSYMLTNQMRGRAIRIDQQVPDKTSSIWHLVAIATGPLSGRIDEWGLERRFNTFLGLAERKPLIQTGLPRLDTRFVVYTEHGWRSCTQDNNREMAARLARQVSLAGRWREAVAGEGRGRVLPGVRTAVEVPPPFVHVRHTLSVVLLALLGWAVVLGLVLLVVAGIGAPLWLLAAVAVAWFAGFATPSAWRLARIAWHHLPVDGALRQIATATRDALCHTGLIQTERSRLSLQIEPSFNGQLCVGLAGGSFHEASLFADALAEVLAPIEQPRYLITRRGRFLGRDRIDHHAVPAVLCTKKEFAETFARAWMRELGPCRLIYTRSDTGRETLLQARVRAFSHHEAERVHREDRWLREAPAT